MSKVGEYLTIPATQQIMSRVSETYEVGCIVWYKHSGWPWWPSKVKALELPGEEGDKEIITINCFKTGDEHTLNDSATTRDKLKPFVHEGVEDFVTRTKKLCYNKKSVYTDLCDAISLAVNHAKMGDPNFSLEIDPHADVGALSQRKTTPKHPNGSTKPFSSPTSSQTRKSSSVSKRTSSTGGRHQKAPPSSSRKGRNSQIVGASAASPCLADALKDISENVVTSGRKRSRGGTDGDRKTSSDSGVKRQKIMDSDCPSRNKAEEKNKEVVSRKLDFSDHEIVEKLPDKSGASTHSSSSPQAKPDGDPSSPCGGSLSNGHVSGLPSVHVEKRNSPVTDLMDLATDDEKTMEVAGLPSCHLKSGDEEKPSTDDIETETVDGSSSDSDDDSLPKFGCDVNENLKVKQLKANSIIWVKFGTKFPYWPALVTDVISKKGSSGRGYIGRVLFFGYNEKKTVGIRNNKYIAPFATKRSEEFLEEGRKCPYRIQFEQAVEEAKTCMEYRANPDDSTSTPRKLFEKVAKLRPKDYIRKKLECPVWSAVDDDEDKQKQPSDEEDKSGGDEFLTGKDRRLFSVDDDEESNSDLNYSDDEEEDAVYSYQRVMAEVDELKPVLVGIVHGRVASELHRKFLEGTRKEQNEIKLAPKAGPLARWPVDKLTKLATKLKEISDEASDGKLLLSYAYSVLLPEFTVRIIQKFESVSEAEAIERLDHTNN